ncbi:hypothetical protein B2D45_09575 [Lactobacillus hilgardii]
MIDNIEEAFNKAVRSKKVLAGKRQRDAKRFIIHTGGSSYISRFGAWPLFLILLLFIITIS